MLKKMKTAVCAAVCGVTMAVLPFMSAECINSEGKTVIMSIGDSITDGYGTDGSYRKFLYHNLTEKGYSIDMVGPNAGWADGNYSDSDTGESFTYDAAHCGYSGYAIKEYPGRQGILETITNGGFLKEYSPDIVILQIGTNDVIDNHDIDTAGERLDVLVSYILENISKDSSLFVTTIPDLDPNREGVYQWFSNYRQSADWQTKYSDEQAESAVHESVKKYNAQVQKLVENKRSSGVSNIYFGDVNSAITDVKTQLKDGVHPNDTGYKSMGSYWTGVISEYLSGSVQPSETTTTEPTTQPTTEPTAEPTTEETTAEAPTEPPVIGCDINGDGNTDIADLTMLAKQLTGEIPMNEKSDVNGDDRVNVIDFIYFKRVYI